MTLGEGNSLSSFRIRQECDVGMSRKEQLWMENRGLHNQTKAYYAYRRAIAQCQFMKQVDPFKYYNKTGEYLLKNSTFLYIFHLQLHCRTH